MAGVLVVLALLSFRDALRFHRKPEAGCVTLQLSDRIKRSIHARLRRGLASRLLLPSVFGTGIVVTLIESLCTGQVYLPTLALIARASSSPIRAIGYLAAYNLMFILPLLTVLALTLGGLRLTRLMNWSRSNLIRAKILTGLLCLALAALLLILQ
jgi:cytochrome c biogenesis protein CcdA